MRLKRGLVQVYTGEGKGKTTAAFGLALRASGQGLRVCIVQFMKREDTGEFRAVKRYLSDNIKIFCFGTNRWLKEGEITEEETNTAKEAFEFAKNAIMSKKYDIVVLDEINMAIDYKLIKLKDVIEIIKRKPKEVELVLTGRGAKKEIIDLSDLVTYMKEVKHPYKKKIGARRGIEY
jgi:cob(I)alamin adenosyltransferase